MRAVDVMTTDVITVDPDTTVQALATLLAERGISGAPVLDSGGRLVGIISEGDLLHRAEIGTARRHRERRRSWWLDHFASDLAREYVKSHGRTVNDIMTRDVATVSSRFPEKTRAPTANRFGASETTSIATSPFSPCALAMRPTTSRSGCTCLVGDLDDRVNAGARGCRSGGSLGAASTFFFQFFSDPGLRERSASAL